MPKSSTPRAHERCRSESVPRGRAAESVARDRAAESVAGSSRRRHGERARVGLIAGRFELVRLLGDGSFATVYEAHDGELDRRVAIKLFTRYEHDEVQAALHEARIMARLRHPSVLTVHDIGEHAGTPFLALEYCATDLRRWLAQRYRTVGEILACFVEAGRGLAAAHDAGLVHHDFKPANVLLREDGSVAVGDFGLARRLDTQDADATGSSDKDEASYAVGTLRYIAPERLLGLAGDERSDQFSFCVALWEALAGEHPFTGSTAQSRFESIQAGPCVVPKLPRRLLRALERGLAADPDDRWPNMHALLGALEHPSQPRFRGHALVSAAVITVSFMLGLGFEPSGTLPEADATHLQQRAAEHALLEARDMLFDGEYERANALLKHTYVKLIRDAPLDEQRELLDDVVLFAKLLEEADQAIYAAEAYHRASVIANKVGQDPTYFRTKRDELNARDEALGLPHGQSVTPTPAKKQAIAHKAPAK